MTTARLKRFSYAIAVTHCLNLGRKKLCNTNVLGAVKMLH